MRYSAHCAFDGPTANSESILGAMNSRPPSGCRAAIADGAEALRELVRTNDVVVLSAIEALLKGAGIAHMIADQNISAIEPLGIFPRRVLVDEDQLAAARRLLTDAGFENELRPDKG